MDFFFSLEIYGWLSRDTVHHNSVPFLAAPWAGSWLCSGTLEVASVLQFPVPGASYLLALGLDKRLAWELRWN